RQVALLRLQAEMPLGRPFTDRSEIEFPMRRVTPDGGRLAVQERSERVAVQMCWRCGAKQVEQRRHHVHCLAEALDMRARGLPSARVADDQRNVETLVEE